MDANKQTTSDTPRVPGNGTAVMLLMTALDTTWRLFGPTIGLTILGIIGDHTFETKPWLTITCVSVGALVSFCLVYAQYKKVKNS